MKYSCVLFFGISLCCNAYNSRSSIDYINIHLFLRNNNMSNIIITIMMQDVQLGIQRVITYINEPRI